MKNKWLGMIYIILGVGIIGLWIMLIMTDQVTELDTNPAEITIHMIVESLMGVFSITTGILLIKRVWVSDYALLFTNGVLAYSVINSSGYYVDLRNYTMVVFFGIILIFVILTSLFTLKKLNT